MVAAAANLVLLGAYLVISGTVARGLLSSEQRGGEHVHRVRAVVDRAGE
jgi:hypothetical protein